MSEQESKIPNYLDYPYDRFLKIRIEFLILTQNDLKARIMRLIERCVENERQTLYRHEKARPSNKGKVVLPDGIFAAISHKFFMEELWGTVQSETTLRDALAELERDHLVIRRPGGTGPYDPPLYTLNKPLIAHLFTLLPPLDEIDMVSLMKQPRKSKKDGGTKIDPLAQKIRDAIIAPPDPQLLDPYASIIGPLSRSRGVQKLYPKRDTEKLEEKEESLDVDANAINTPPAPSFSSQPIPITKAPSNAKEQNKPKKNTPLVSDEELALRKQVHEWVNRRRGYSIQGRSSAALCRKENEDCIVLASMLYRGQQGDPDGTSFEELDEEWDWITTHDKYWSQPENKSRIGAGAILQMHAQTVVIIRKRKKPSAPPAQQAGTNPSSLPVVGVSGLPITRAHGKLPVAPKVARKRVI